MADKSKSPADKAFALHVAAPGAILSIIYGPLNTTWNKFWVQSLALLDAPPPYIQKWKVSELITK